MKDSVQKIKAEADALLQDQPSMLVMTSAARAVDLYTTAIAEDGGTTPALYTNRAFAFLTLKQYDKAIEDCKASLGVDARWARGYQRMADALRHQDRMYPALECLERCQEISPSDENDKLIKEWKGWLKGRGCLVITRPPSNPECLEGQRDVAAMARRRVDCMLGRHFSIHNAETNEEIPLDALATSRLMPGETEIVVRWRHPADFDKKGGQGQTPSFPIWDPSTLALELHTMATPYCDPERKGFLGGLLYFACWDGQPWFFWSLSFYWLHTGVTLPARDKLFAASDSTTMPSLYLKDLEAMSERLKSVPKGGTANVGSVYMCLTIHMQEMNRKPVPRKSSLLEGRIPKYGDTPQFSVQRPQWWLRQDDFWASQFRLVKHQGVAPCMWVCKNACIAGWESCTSDHEVILNGVSDVQRGLTEPVKEQNKTHGQQQKTVLMSSVVTCSSCEKEFDTAGTGDPVRCEVCGNTLYCSAICERTHRTTHAPNCRKPLGETGPVNSESEFETITHGWVIVLPAGSTRKPYAKLIPAGEGPSFEAVKQILGARGERGEMKQWQAKRGDLVHGDIYIMAKVNNPHDEPNLRAAAITVDIVAEGANGALQDTEGPNVRIRGDAVAIRWGLVIESGNRIRMCQKRGIRDFGWKDFDNMYGYFQCVQMLEARKAMCCVFPNTPAGQQQGMSLMNMILQATNGRHKSNEEEVERMMERDRGRGRGGGRGGYGPRNR